MIRQLKKGMSVSLVVLLAFLGLLFVACGDDDDATDGGVTPGVDAVEEVTEDATTPDATEDPVAEVTVDVAPDLVPDGVPDGVADGVADGVSDATDAADATTTDATDATDTADATTTTPEGILIITEVVEGAQDGTQLPKWVELTNVGDGSVDLSDYYIGTYTNGDTMLNTFISGTAGPWVVQLAGTLATCGLSYVINYEGADTAGTSFFNTVYGVDPSTFEPGANFNGDDVIALFLGMPTAPGDLGTALMVDIYGVIGTTDGDWLYGDGYAYRLPTVSAQFVTGCSTSGTDVAGCSMNLAEWWATAGVFTNVTGTDFTQYTTVTTPFAHTANSCSD